MIDKILTTKEYSEKFNVSIKSEGFLSDDKNKNNFKLFQYNNATLFSNNTVIIENKYIIKNHIKNKEAVLSNTHKLLEDKSTSLIELNDCEYIALLENKTNSYWYWFFNYLPLAIVSEILGFNGKYIIKNDYFFNQKLETLELLGIDSNRVLIQKENNYFIIKNLLFIETNDSRLEIPLKIIHDKILDKLPKKISNNKKIYISRNNNKRMVLNEEEIWEILEYYGFIKITLENYTLEEQIKLISESNFLIGGHGSGMALSLFMQEKSRIIEFFSSTYINYYYSLINSKILNHDHRMLVTELCGEYPYGSTCEANILVNMKYLEVILENIFGY
ncbi:MAG: glycosyltransferase family 61 protein [Candidatus Sericytochromatia bacterium]